MTKKSKFTKKNLENKPEIYERFLVNGRWTRCENFATKNFEKIKNNVSQLLGQNLGKTTLLGASQLGPKCRMRNPDRL